MLLFMTLGIKEEYQQESFVFPFCSQHGLGWCRGSWDDDDEPARKGMLAIEEASPVNATSEYICSMCA